MKGAGLHTVHTVDDMHSSGQSRLRITLCLTNTLYFVLNSAAGILFSAYRVSANSTNAKFLASFFVSASLSTHVLSEILKENSNFFF